MTFYMNLKTGEMTDTKPGLYRGEDGPSSLYDRKGKSKATENPSDAAERIHQMLLIVTPLTNSVTSDVRGSVAGDGHNVLVVFDDTDTTDEFAHTLNGVSLQQMAINKVMIHTTFECDIFPGLKAFVDKTGDIIRKSWSSLPPRADVTLQEMIHEFINRDSIEKLKAFIEVTDMVDTEDYLESTPYPLVNLMRPLHDAIMRDNFERFGELVENSDIERENRVGYTPLQLAVMLDRFDMASILLAHGANTDKELLDIGTYTTSSL